MAQKRDNIKVVPSQLEANYLAEKRAKESKEADLMDEAMTEALQKARRTDNPNKIDFETLQMLIWWTQNALNDIHGFK